MRYAISQMPLSVLARLKLALAVLFRGVEIVLVLDRKAANRLTQDLMAEQKRDPSARLFHVERRVSVYVPCVVAEEQGDLVRLVPVAREYHHSVAVIRWPDSD